MNLLKKKKWIKGRQNSGYFKFPILATKYFDCYLIKYVKGVSIPPHTDPIDYGRHFRLNIILPTKFKGGEFISEKSIINTKYIKLFRPDLNIHSVSKVTEGYRLVLSIGMVI